MLLSVAEKSAALPYGYSDEENVALLKATLNLFNAWDLTDQQAAILLGGISTKSLQRWRQSIKDNAAKPQLSIDQCDRAAHLLGIHAALRTLFSESERIYGWVKRENSVFEQQSALDIMLHGHLADIARIRRYLDSVVAQ